MAWDEWERIKASAAERRFTEMRLDQPPADRAGDGPSGGAGGSRLRHAARPWNRAAATAGILRTSTRTARTDLATGHAGTAGGLAGLSSLASLTSVLDSWEDRLGAVEDECVALEPALRRAGGELVGADHGVAARTTNAVRVPHGGDAT
ncbi:amino acid ABC transporter permease [Streptomyces tirandamycinicus]|uniref:Amino acid ABC transporter permease n=1 Tax=Streptomyces tirandamycinicus TaxID=2174846 RepID=A0A2S1SR52_9ACTN|nr:amino acid ABC transporter permease [Streptomyces tirandamycinicus]AWI28881.1 amino acid ABC transporter permease [Streptomyces tirandamycinicus]